MRNLLFLLTLFLLSCNTYENKKIIYSYNNLNVIRIDKENKILFYLNELNKDSFIISTIKGRDGLMQGYLRFNKNGTIDIIRRDGIFEDSDSQDNLNLLDLHFSKFRLFEKKIEKNYDNVYFISDYNDLEIRMNKENNSKVSSKNVSK